MNFFIGYNYEKKIFVFLSISFTVIIVIIAVDIFTWYYSSLTFPYYDMVTEKGKREIPVVVSWTEIDSPPGVVVHCAIWRNGQIVWRTFHEGKSMYHEAMLTPEQLKALYISLKEKAKQAYNNRVFMPSAVTGHAINYITVNFEDIKFNMGMFANGVGSCHWRAQNYWDDICSYITTFIPDDEGVGWPLFVGRGNGLNKL